MRSEVLNRVDDQVKDIYLEAMNIIKENEDYLYCDGCLEVSMWPINSVTVNGRCSNRCGMCRYRGRSVDIEISKFMLSLPREEALSTMIHELLHAFRDSKGHTGKWARRASVLSRNTGLDITRLHDLTGFNLPEKKHVYKKTIILKCDSCDYTIIKHKESRITRYPDHFRHTGCGGHFVRCD